MIISGPAFLDALRDHRLLEDEQLARLELEFRGRQQDAGPLAAELIRRGLLTPFQAELLLQGRAAELSLRDNILLEPLGEGGMGVVFKARHRILKSVRAVKVIRPDCLTSKRAIDRFYKESQAVARLKHPNIILAHDAGQEGERHFFI